MLGCVCVCWHVWEYELNKRNKKGNIKNKTHEKVSAATTTTTSRWQFQFVELNLIKNQVEGHLREHCLPHASFAVIALSLPPLSLSRSLLIVGAAVFVVNDWTKDRNMPICMYMACEWMYVYVTRLTR